MAGEIRVNSLLVVKKTSANIDFQSRPALWSHDMAGSAGGAPGHFTATEDGVDVDLSDFADPGMYWLNVLGSFPVVMGRFDPDSDKFYPLNLYRPGKPLVGEFSPDVEEEYSGTGTGTTAIATTLRIKAIGGSSTVQLVVFER